MLSVGSGLTGAGRCSSAEAQTVPSWFASSVRYHSNSGSTPCRYGPRPLATTAAQLGYRWSTRGPALGGCGVGVGLLGVGEGEAEADEVDGEGGGGDFDGGDGAAEAGGVVRDGAVVAVVTGVPSGAGGSSG